MRWMAPSGARTPRRAENPSAGSGRWCSTPVQMMRSNRPSQLSGPLDRKPGQLEIRKAVFLLERLGVAQTRRAHIDADHVGVRPAQGMPRRLRRPAAGDQHLQVRAVVRARKVQVKIGAAPALVPPPPAVAFQLGGRRRIGMLLVEALHGFPHGIGV